MKNKELECIYERMIVESSLSRLWQFVENRKPFAILSWQRAGMSISEENEVYSELKKTIRNMGYGFIELHGGYTEQDPKDPEKKIDIDSENSLFVPNMTLNDVLEVGAVDNGHGPQDSVLHSDGEGIAYYITNPAVGQVGSVDTKFKYGQGKDAIPMAKKAVEKYFSKLVKGSHAGRKFAFVQENFFLEELSLDRRYPKYPNENKWKNWGIRVI